MPKRTESIRTLSQNEILTVTGSSSKTIITCTIITGVAIAPFYPAAALGALVSATLFGTGALITNGYTAAIDAAIGGAIGGAGLELYNSKIKSKIFLEPVSNCCNCTCSIQM